MTRRVRARVSIPLRKVSRRLALDAPGHVAQVSIPLRKVSRQPRSMKTCPFMSSVSIPLRKVSRYPHSLRSCGLPILVSIPLRKVSREGTVRARGQRGGVSIPLRKVSRSFRSALRSWRRRGFHPSKEGFKAGGPWDRRGARRPFPSL